MGTRTGSRNKRSSAKSSRCFTLRFGSARKQLGYDLRLMYFDDQKATLSGHPTIYLHGWSSSARNFYSSLSPSSTLPDTHEKSLLALPAIFFHFPDAGLTKPFLQSVNRVWPMARYRTSTLCFKNLLQAGFKRIDLFGYSRGGATTLNTIAVLNNPQYQPQLHAMGIDEDTRKGILDMIQQGCITLDSPLKDVYSAVAKGLANYASSSIIKAIGNAVSKIKKKCHLSQENNDSQDDSAKKINRSCNNKMHIARLIHGLKLLTEIAFKRITGFLGNYIFLPLLTRYRPWSEQGLCSAAQLANLKLNVLLHYEHNDSVVSNWGDSSLFELLKKQNPKTTFCAISDDKFDQENRPCDPHFAQRLVLPEILNSFKDKFQELPGQQDFAKTLLV